MGGEWLPLAWDEAIEAESDGGRVVVGGRETGREGRRGLGSWEEGLGREAGGLRGEGLVGGEGVWVEG